MKFEWRQRESVSRSVNRFTYLIQIIDDWCNRFTCTAVAIMIEQTPLPRRRNTKCNKQRIGIFRFKFQAADV